MCDTSSDDQLAAMPRWRRWVNKATPLQLSMVVGWIYFAAGVGSTLILTH